MKFPNHGSTSWTVIESIFKHGPLSVEQGLAKHGVLDGYPSHTRTIYERCVRAGWLVEVDGIHSLSPKMMDRMLERKAAEVKTPEIVQPRTHNVYATTLHPSRMPNLQRAIDKRPGSGDLIGIPSHYARLV